MTTFAEAVCGGGSAEVAVGGSAEDVVGGASTAAGAGFDLGAEGDVVARVDFFVEGTGTGTSAGVTGGITAPGVTGGGVRT